MSEDDDVVLCEVCGALIIDDGPLVGECPNETPCKRCGWPHHDRGDGICPECQEDAE